jgi:RNA polymerase sigma-70 factor (ECF subfamily)
VTRLYRYACRRLGADTAEDAVADTFLVAFGARTRYDLARPDAGPWLFGILSKEISRRQRTELIRYRALRRTGPDRPVDGPEQRVADGVTAAAQRGQLARALAGLTPGDRDVLLLVAWGDLSYQEVADALDIPIGTVRSRLNRARRTVRAALGGDDPTRDTDDNA